MTALALVRALHFLSLMTVFGAETMALLLRAKAAIEDRALLPRWFVTACAGIALLTAALWLLLAAMEMSGGGLLDITAVATVLRETLFGQAMAARLVLLVLLIVAIVVEAPVILRILSSGAALAAIALTSHAAATGTVGGQWALAANDAAHLLAASIWLGGLALLAPLVIRQRHTAEALVPALRTFSRWGAGAVAVLVLAGTINAYVILFNGGARWSPTYLTLLAMKLVLAGIMTALALTNRFGLVSALRRDEPEAQESLTLSIVAELVAGVLIVAIVGFLGLLPPRLG